MLSELFSFHLKKHNLLIVCYHTLWLKSWDLCTLGLTTVMLYLLEYLVPHLTDCSKSKIWLPESWLWSGASDHTTPILELLRWLPVRLYIDVNVLMFTYKALHSLAPHYLSALSPSSPSSCNLHSSNSELLCFPQTHLCAMGDRAFSC